MGYMRTIGGFSVAAGLAVAGGLHMAEAASLSYATGTTRVWWLDAVRREVIDSLEVEEPGPIAVGQGGTVLYVGSRREREPFQVVTISTDARTAQPLASLPGVPKHLALSPDGRLLWVAHWKACAEGGDCTGRSGVSAVDVRTGNVVSTFDQLQQGIVGPNGIAVSGEKAYFTDVSKSSVGIIDTRSLTLLDPVGSFCCLGSAIAISPDGASVHALGNEFGGFMVTIDTATGTLRQSDFIIGQDPERGDLEFDIEIGADNVTALLAADVCDNRTCGGTLLFFDTARYVLQGSLPLAAVPTRIALTAADRFALLALPGAESVAVVDLASRRVAGQIAVGEAVYDVAASRACVGDCDASGDVRINEVIVGVRIGLGMREIDACRSLDRDGNATVMIDEVTAAVSNAMEGC